MHWRLPDTHWQSTEDFAVTEKLLLILSAVLFSDVARNLQRNISIRECRIVVSGRIQTGSYTNREGQKVYTTEVVVEEQEFAESKASSDSYAASHPQQQCSTGSVNAEPGSSKRRWLYEHSGWNR